MFILGLSAYWDSSIRVLHVFEAIPYALAALLCLRGSKWGFFLGTASGAFWLWMAGTRTTFVRNGFERVATLLTTGAVDRWDIFIAAPAAISTAGLALFSLWSYFRAAPKSADILRFAVTFALVVAYFATIFWLVAPQYLRLFPSVLA